MGWAGVSLVGGGRGVRVRARGAVVSIFLFFGFGCVLGCRRVLCFTVVDEKKK